MHRFSHHPARNAATRPAGPRRMVYALFLAIILGLLGLVPAVVPIPAVAAQAQIDQSACQQGTYACWMGNNAAAIGQRPLNQVIMPGSHDAATYGFPSGTYTRNQDSNFYLQLVAGVRSFDLRLALSDDKTKFVPYHGNFKDNGTDFTSIMNDIESFTKSPGAEREIFHITFSAWDLTVESALLHQYCDDFYNRFGAITLSPAQVKADTGASPGPFRSMNELWALPNHPRIIVENGFCNVAEAGLNQEQAAYWAAQRWDDINSSYYANSGVYGCIVDALGRALPGRNRGDEGALIPPIAGCNENRTGLGTTVPGLYTLFVQQTGFIPGLSAAIATEQAVLETVEDWFRDNQNNARANLNVISGDFIDHQGDCCSVTFTLAATSVGLNLAYNGDQYAGGPQITVAKVSSDPLNRQYQVTCYTTSGLSFNAGAITILGQSGGPTTPSGTTASGTFTVPSGNSATFQCIDNTNRIARLVVDATPPDTTIANTPTNPSSVNSASFTFAGSDNYTPTESLTFECKLDNAVFGSCTSPQSHSSLADGSHTFQVRASDAAGNVDPTPATFTWTVDTTPPDTTIAGAPTGLVAIGSDLTFTFTGTDGNGTGVVAFACQFDAGVPTPCTSPQTYTGVGLGTHSFQVFAVDRAGNFDPSPATATVKVVNPTITTVANANANYGDPSVTLSATVTSASGTDNGGTVAFKVKQGSTVIGSGSGAVVNGVATWTFPLGNTVNVGTYTIEASYSGSGDFPPSTATPGTLTVAKAGTSLAVSNVSVVYGEASVTLSATVTSANGAALTGGTVTFVIKQGNQTRATLTSGQVVGASPVTVSVNLPLGTGYTARSYTIVATYSGNAQFKPADASGTLQVTRRILWVKPTDRTVGLKQPNPPTTPPAGCAPTGCWLELVNGSTFAPGESWSSLNLTNLRFQYSRNPATTNASEQVGSTYRITALGATSTNYELRFQPGTLKVVR